jgi:putative sterol carrier protein
MTLAQYIRDLVEALREADAEAFARMRRAVGDRRARISLDDESVVVAFRGDSLVSTVDSGKGANELADGHGATERDTVLDILDGRLEVTEAILLGRLNIQAAAQDLDRILFAIEVLLGAATYVPAMRAIEQHFRADRHRIHSPLPPPEIHWRPPAIAPEELAMLARLDLL